MQSGTEYFTDHLIEKSMSTDNLPVTSWCGLIGKTPSAISLGVRFDATAAGVAGPISRIRTRAGQNTAAAVAVQP